MIARLGYKIGWIGLALLLSMPVLADGKPPPMINVAGKSLVLNGYGQRELLLTALYRCALYLPEPTTEPEDVIVGDRPIAILVDVLYSDPGEEIPDKWAGLIRRELSEPMYRQFERLYQSLSKGDRVLFRYHSDLGTEILVNSKPALVLRGPGLMRALLNQWVGSDPVSTELRAALLAGADGT